VRVERDGKEGLDGGELDLENKFFEFERHAIILFTFIFIIDIVLIFFN
jgi:hypothetical protein